MGGEEEEEDNRNGREVEVEDPIEDDFNPGDIDDI
jgi:hypothetical protein